MPTVDSYARPPQPFVANGFLQQHQPAPSAMSQHLAKPNFYASNGMNVAPPPTSGAQGGMSGNPFAPQNAVDAYRFPNAQQQQLQSTLQRHKYSPQRPMDFVKPANPPLKMLVPGDMVGAIIGRGGATIREITKASRARVDVHRNYETSSNAGQSQQQQQPNGILPPVSTNTEKVISIFGKEGESISAACKKILEVIDAEVKKIRQNRMECGVPAFINGMSMMGGNRAGASSSTMMTLLPETALKMLAPNALIGRIIGKQGKKVNEIKDKSGAKITVSNVYDINAEYPERTIIITGTLEAMCSAETKISEILRVCHQQEMTKYPSHGGPDGPDYFSPTRYRETNNNNTNSINHNNIPAVATSAAAAAANSPYSNYLARGGSLPPNARGGIGSQSHLVGQSAMIGAGMIGVGTMNHNGPPMLPHHHTQMPPPQFGGPSGMHEENQGMKNNSYAADTNLDTVFLYVPAPSVGAIIGKKGESVRQITRYSGAVIKIAAETKIDGGGQGEAEASGATTTSNGVVGSSSSSSDAPTPPRDASKTPGEKSVAITAGHDSQCRAIAQIFKKLYEERLFGPDPPFLALDLLIPSSQMGKVLGKQKLKIRTIERRTGVNIRVPENNNDNAITHGTTTTETDGVSAPETDAAGKSPDHDEDSLSYVTIRGNLPQMIQAMTMVKEILHGGELPRSFFTRPPFPPHPYPPFGHRAPPRPNFRGPLRGRARF